VVRHGPPSWSTDAPDGRGGLVTTIRVTRRPPASDNGSAPSKPDRLRLALIEPRSPRTSLDGAWWPRTADLGEELPALLTELHARGIRATRVAYNPGSWAPAPRRLDADGRVVRLGWFRGLDRHLLNLSGDLARGRVDLLVVPPGTSALAAAAAFTSATEPDNRQTATEVLAAATAGGRAQA
jgi:hypothetical protein